MPSDYFNRQNKGAAHGSSTRRTRSRCSRESCSRSRTSCTIRCSPTAAPTTPGRYSSSRRPPWWRTCECSPRTCARSSPSGATRSRRRSTPTRPPTPRGPVTSRQRRTRNSPPHARTRRPRKRGLWLRINDRCQYRMSLSVGRFLLAGAAHTFSARPPHAVPVATSSTTLASKREFSVSPRTVGVISV